MEGGVGNVFGYHYAVDNYYTGGGYAANWQQCDQFHHNAGDYYNLWEGNIGICHTEDSIHGTAFANTVFRNALSEFDPAITNGTAKSTNVLSINNMAYARYINYVANVLGYGGHASTYQYLMSSLTDCGSGSNGIVFAIGDRIKTWLLLLAGMDTALRTIQLPPEQSCGGATGMDPVAPSEQIRVKLLRTRQPIQA